MAHASDYLENALLAHIFGGAAYTVPTNLYLSLYTSAPNDDDSGTEVSGNGYARANHNAWNAAAARVSSNNGQINFPQATGGGWGTITHFGIHDASSLGNLLFWGPLDTPRVVNVGATPQFGDGKVQVSFLANGWTDYLVHAILDHVLKVAPYAQPATYAGFYTTATSDAGGGTEVTGGSYARQQVSAWDAPVAGVTQNSNTVSFPTATASWGTVSHQAVLDAVSAGNMLTHAAMDSAQLVDNGFDSRYDAGALVQTLD